MTGSSGAPRSVGTTAERIVRAGDFLRRLPSRDGLAWFRLRSPENVAGGDWRFFATTAPGVEGIVTVRRVSDFSVVAQFTAADLAPSGWSTPLPKAALAISAPSDLALDIRYVGISFIKAVPQTPVGTPNLVPFIDYPSDLDLKAITRGVGLLSFLSQDEAALSGGATAVRITCTAFLVDPDLAVTAAHCVPTTLNGKLAELRLGHVTDGVQPFERRTRVSLVKRSLSLDAALLRLAHPSEPDAVLRFAPDDPARWTRLLVLQHFGGEPLSVSADEDCQVYEVGAAADPAWEDGREITISDALVLHGCDTTSSSSGSPVLDRRTRRVVGMHQRGYGDDAPEVNKALRVFHLERWIASVRAAEDQ